jgi:tetratricopeptide (TPR) repeat protein
VHDHTRRNHAGLALSEASLARALATEHEPLIATARYRVAVFLEKQGKYDAATDAWVASFHDAALAGHDQLAAEAASALSFCEGYQLARYDTGIRWAELAGVYLERLGATETHTEATRLDALAVLRESKGDLTGAIATHEHALALRRRLVAPNHHSIGYGLANLAGVLEATGDRERAREHLLEAKAIFEASFGPDNPTTAHVLNNLANLQIHLGEYDEAEPLLVRTQTIWRANLPPDHPDLGDVENAFGDLRRGQGRLDEAVAAHERALAIHKRGLAPDHPQIAKTEQRLAEAKQLRDRG